MTGVPAGHPGTLRAAAHRFQATAEQMQSHAETVGLSVVAEVATWRGWASLAHGAVAAWLARDLATAPRAFAEAASALTVLADALDDAQQEARQVLAQIEDAEAGIASLERARATQTGPGMQLLNFELADARSRAAGLSSALVAIEERAEQARLTAAARFEDVSAMAPIVRQARGGDARLGSDRYARNPRLALLIDVIATAVGASTPEELRAILGELSADDLALVLEAAPGLAMMLTETGLPQSPRTGSLEARLLTALDTSCDPEDKIAGIARFFAQLSDEETMKLALLYPTVVGNLNGAPLDARIAANRVHMVGERARLQLRIEQMRARHEELIDTIASGDAGSPGSTDAWRLAQEVGLLQDRIDDEVERLKVLSGFLDDRVDNPLAGLGAGGSEKIKRRFLVFDPRDGLLAELHGVIGERTRDVGILVPGTGADFLGFDVLSERGARFARYRNDASLATITWLGYDAPNSVGSDAPFNNYADEGGPSLRDFVTGLGLDDDIDTTVVGHSYGGAVVGAAEREGMIVDNVVHVASAGASVEDVSDYPHESRRYSLTAPRDPIKIAQGHAPGWIPGKPENIGHGLDPDEIPGVTRLETGRVDAEDPHSPTLGGLSAHTDVLDEERSDSWRNIYNVMVGGEVTLYSGPTGLSAEFIDVPGTVAPLIVPVFEHGVDNPEYVPPTKDVP